MDQKTYVSHGAAKLAAALDHFGLSPAGLTCLDVGCGIGGFTEILLERGAAKVFAIDSDRERLHPSLRGDDRVVWREQVNARRITPRHIPSPLQAIVVDTSPNGLRLTLPAPLALADAKAWLVGLVRPELELPQEKLGPDGVVDDRALELEAVRSVEAFIRNDCGWEVHGHIESPVGGLWGNREYLIAASRG